MHDQRFDDLLRSFASRLSRRATLAALASGVFGAGSLALLDDAEARKKHKRKKKKKCKGGAKRCGKKCVPATGCCSTSDCGNGATCVNRKCSCPSGFKNCEGECITVGQCCEACPGEKVCAEGVCACPANAPFECPGDQCFSDTVCCVTEECSGDKECVEGICLCPGADAINCNELCCDGDTEVCKLEKVGNEFVSSCQLGSCPATDFCSDSATEQFVCALDLGRVCVCTSTADLIAGQVCVDVESLHPESCQECDTTSDCGTGRVCVPGGDRCDCGVNFCVSLCPEATLTSAKRGAAGTPVDLEAITDGLRKRRRSTQ